jgi:Helix-turn-helix domain
MPAPLPFALRQRVWVGFQRGDSPGCIARQLRLHPRSVRRLCQAFRRRGPAALTPAYPRRTEPAALPPAVQQALLLHEQHPTWGAPYLRIRLAGLHPGLAGVPSARTLQRYFARHRQPPAPPGRRPAAAARARADRPHAVWQMDAVEQLPLAGGQRVSWLRWVDEFTGAVLGTAVFPPRGLRAGARGRRPAGHPGPVRPVGPAGGRAGG